MVWSVFDTSRDFMVTGKIVWIKSLSLSNNKLILLPPNIGDCLKQCAKLDYLLCEIPPCLLELPTIFKLNMSYNVIVEVRS